MQKPRKVTRILVAALLGVAVLLVAGISARRLSSKPKVRRLTRQLLGPRAGAALQNISTNLADAAPQIIREHPIVRYHDVVRPKRLDKWEIIGPGGGGTFYSPTVSPFDSNLVFTTSDMTQCYATENGGVTWRQFNLRAQCGFVFDPKLPNRVYAATGLAVWRSDDRGRTWNIFWPMAREVTRLLYVDDEAEPWTLVEGHVGPRARAFAVDPEDSNTVFIVVDEFLYVSNDLGKTWKQLTKCGAIKSMYVDPSSPRAARKIWFLSGLGAAVWDGTKLIPSTEAESKIGSYYSGAAFAVKPDGRPVLYTARDFHIVDGVLKGGGVEVTEDGLTWRSLSPGILKLVVPNTNPEFSALATSALHPEVIYASVYRLHLPNDTQHRYYGVIKSADGGATWSVVRKEEGEVAPNMHDSWMSYTYGPDFGDQPLGIGVDAHNPDIVYTSDLGRVMKSADGGKNWHAVYSQGTENGYTTTGLDVTTCYGVHFDPFDPKRMFITYTDIGLFRSEDAGKSWMSATTRNGVPRPWWNTAYWMEFDPEVRGRMWAAMSREHDIPRMRMFNSRGKTAGFQGGVVVSDNGGKSWKSSSGGLPQMSATHILLDPKSPKDARVLYVTGFGRGVFKSTDGGQHWTAKNNGLPPNEPLTWRMTMDKNGTLYVVVIRRSQRGEYGTKDDGMIFRSRDGAETWERLPLPPTVNGPVAITVDPVDPQRLYVSAWGRYTLWVVSSPPPDGGVYLSTDGGAHWKNSLDASRRIYDVTVDSADPNIVYAVGFEAAAFRSTDRGQTWSRIRGFNFKDGHRVIVDPADHSKIYITTFGSSVWHGPATGDPEAQEDIVGPPVMRFDARQQ